MPRLHFPIDVTNDKIENKIDEITQHLVEQESQQKLPSKLELADYFKRTVPKKQQYILDQIAELKKEIDQSIQLLDNYDAVESRLKTKQTTEANKIAGLKYIVCVKKETNLVEARKWCRSHTKCTQKDGTKWRFIDADFQAKGTPYYMATRGSFFLFADAEVAMLFKLTFG